MANLQIQWGNQKIDLPACGRRGDFVLVSANNEIVILHNAQGLEGTDRLRYAGAIFVHDTDVKKIRYVRVREPIQLRIDEIVRQLGGEIIESGNEHENGEGRRGKVDDTGTEDIPF